MNARLTVESIKQSAINFPEDNLFIQCDGMDNAKVVFLFIVVTQIQHCVQSYLPRYLENSKQLVGTERLPTKITGCNIYSGFYEVKRKCIFYLNHDHFGKKLKHMCSFTLAQLNPRPACFREKATLIIMNIFLNILILENGSDMIVTIIYKLLEEFIQDHGKLPRKLHLNLGMQ